MKAGRRQFMQTIASTSVAPMLSCSGSSDEPRPKGSGGGSGAGTASGGAGSTGSGGNSQANGGATENGTGGGNEGAAPLSSPLGVALLGLGNYASNLLAPALTLTQHCKLVGIITGTPSKVAEWQSEYGIEDKNVYNYDNMGNLIDNPDIDVVYVVTPNHVHAEFAIKVARAKKHVWLEKPMAMTTEECQSIIDACNENGVKLAIGYRMQHEPNTKTVIEYASSQPFGAIERIEALSGFSGFNGGNNDVWRLKAEMGGGALFDMGVYSINAARYATGEEPVRVLSATQGTNRPEIFTEVDEWFEFELEFPSGVVAHCKTSFGENLNLLDVQCTSGSYKLEPMQSYTGVRGERSDGVQLDLQVDNQQARQMDDDALSLIEGRPMMVPGEEGLRDVRIVQALFSAAQNGAPVDLE